MRLARFSLKHKHEVLQMSNLKGSKTEGNLKAAFAGESQANRRYLYFAQKADVEGFNDVSAVLEPFRLLICNTSCLC